MVEKIRNMNTALPGMMLGILLYGVLCEVIGVFLVANPLIYSISLWIGIVMAEGMALHMAWTLNRALDRGEGSAQSMVRKHNFLRYGFVVVLFAVVLVTKTLNPLYAFLGIMGLKVGAYVQPFTHKLFKNKHS